MCGWSIKILSRVLFKKTALIKNLTKNRFLRAYLVIVLLLN